MTKDRTKKKRRKKKGGGGGGPTGGSPRGGVMQSMVRGFRQAAGVEKSKTTGKSGWVGNLIWILLIAALAAFVVSRYSR